MQDRTPKFKLNKQGRLEGGSITYYQMSGNIETLSNWINGTRYGEYNRRADDIGNTTREHRYYAR
jgi:hypothetical protein